MTLKVSASLACEGRHICRYADHPGLTLSHSVHYGVPAVYQLSAPAPKANPHGTIASVAAGFDFTH